MNNIVDISKKFNNMNSKNVFIKMYLISNFWVI